MSDPKAKAERWQRIDSLFEAALGRAAEERDDFLDQACGEDTDLRYEIERLLQADAAAASFLEQPAFAFGPEVPSDLQTAIGGHIGPYRLVRCIGQGGMGDVYLAARDDSHYRRLVALKVSRRDLSSGEVRRRFLAERQILARLEHPNIARLYDGGATEDGRPFLVMELVEGLPIDEYCDHHRLGIDRRLQLFLRVCDAVQYAHQNLLVHRDLKPSNVLVTADGIPKLLDFGIAKILDPDTLTFPAVATRTGHRPMTLASASPEQVRGEAITTASDVYSLGVLLYRLLAGRRPYRLRTDMPHDLERAICEQEPELPSSSSLHAAETAADSPERAAIAHRRSLSPRELGRRLRGDLDNIVLEAMHKRPEQRYASAEQLAADVRRHLADQPVLARAGNLAYRARKFLRRHRLAVAVTATVLVLICASTLALALQARQLAHQRDTAAHERGTAQAALDFMISVFETAPLSQREAEGVSARELLDSGALRVATELEDQPAIQATLTEVIGSIYASFGLYDDSFAQRVRGVEIAKRLHGDRHPEVAEALANLAGVHSSKAAYGEAEGLLKEALDILRENRDSGELQLAETLGLLADVLAEQGRYPEAELLSRQALSSVRQALGPRHAATATRAIFLAVILRATGDLAEAETLLREAIPILRDTRGPNDFFVAQQITNLASILDDQGRYDEAESLFREALKTHRRIRDPGHPDVVTTLNNLGVLLIKKGDPGAAEPILREVLASYRILFGDDHPNVAAARTNLAGALVECGQVGEAEPLARQAHAAFAALLGPEHPAVSSALVVLAKALAQRPGDEAEEALRRALDIRKAAFAAGHWRIAEAQGELGALLADRGRLAAAEPLLLACLRIYEGHFPPGHRKLVEAAERLSRARGEPERAARYPRQAG